MARTNSPRTLSAQDASFLWWERGTQHLHVGAVTLLDGPVEHVALIRLIEERLCSLPRWRQRPVRPVLDWHLPTWENVPGFEPRFLVRHVAAPPPGRETDLRTVCEAIFSTPLDPELPLWEFTLVSGLEGDRSAVVSKLHHCMIDGVSGAQVLDALTDSDDGSPPPLPPGIPEPVAVSPLDRLAIGLRTAWEIGTTLFEFFAVPPTPLPFTGPLSPARQLVWTSFSLDDILALRGAAGCKVNDIVLAIITGALRREILACGGSVDRAVVRAMVPVSTRTAGQRDSLGNLVSAMSPLLPVHLADAGERLRAIQRELRARKERGQAQAMSALVSLLDVLPSAVDALLGRLTPDRLVYSTVCTNIPGPRGRRTMLGRRVLDIHPYVPLAFRMGIEFAILSQGDRLSISATVDPALVPQADRLADALRDAFAELQAAFRPAEPLAPSGAGGGMRVGDLMTSPVLTLGPRDSLATAWRLMRRARIRHLPVVAPDGKLLGLLTQRDLLGASTSTVTVPDEAERVGMLALVRAEDVMESHVQVTRADAPAAEAGACMLRGKIGCLPVVDAEGRLAGIVTAEDFLRWATNRLGEAAGGSAAGGGIAAA